MSRPERSTRPGRASVCAPCSTIGSPFTTRFTVAEGVDPVSRNGAAEHQHSPPRAFVAFGMRPRVGRLKVSCRDEFFGSENRYRLLDCFG